METEFANLSVWTNLKLDEQEFIEVPDGQIPSLRNVASHWNTCSSKKFRVKKHRVKSRSGVLIERRK